MSYKIEAAMTSFAVGGALAEKIPQTYKSLLYLQFSGNNVWGTQRLTIDASALASGTSKNFDIVDYSGSVIDEKQENWETFTETVPATNLISLPDWLKTNRKITVSGGPYADVPMIEDYDYEKDTTNNRITILRDIFTGYELNIGYWKTSTKTFTLTGREALIQTILNLVTDINASENLFVETKILGDKTSVMLVSTFIGDDSENGDDITISRSNVAAGEILINDIDQDGPIALSGFESNKLATGVGMLFSTGYEKDYLQEIGGFVIRMGTIREYTDSQFESLTELIKADLARSVTKGLLKVYYKDEDASSSSGGASWGLLTSYEVIHSGYIDTHAI